MTFDMASSSRLDVSGRKNKRARYSRSRQKAKFSVPYLGFENEKLKPTVRGSVDLDARFLPYGIPPGTILEIKGPEKSGKTFLLTYFIVRMLTVYPTRKAVLINTRHKFNAKNFLSIVRSFDEDLKNAQLNLNEPVEDLIRICPKVGTYLDRLLIIPCYSAEDLMLTLGPSGESVVQKLLLNDSSVSLVAIDSIDNFSFAECLRKEWGAHNPWPGIMENLKDSVSQTKCPVICTTLIPANKHEYRNKIVPRRLTGNGGEPSTSSRDHPRSNKGDQEEVVKSNFTIDYSVFTKIMELVPASKTEKEKSVHLWVAKANHYAYAYLRSKHSANTAGSGENHRVKFSIFSDMLWVADG